jgi:hypothetical protein
MTLPAALRDPGIHWENCRPLDVEVVPAKQVNIGQVLTFRDPVLGRRARTLAQVYEMEVSRR